MRAALAALTLCAAVAQPAAAHEPSTYEGGCGFESIAHEHVGGADRYVGIAYAAVAVHSPDHGNPVSATVTCEIEVDGVVEPTAVVSGSGTGIVVAAGQIAFTAGLDSIVRLCETVDFTSDGTPTVRVCEEPPRIVIPPSEYPQVISLLLELFNEHVDPAVCEETGGDLWVGDVLVWDCPPYEPI